MSQKVKLLTYVHYGNKMLTKSYPYFSESFIFVPWRCFDCRPTMTNCYIDARLRVEIFFNLLQKTSKYSIGFSSFYILVALETCLSHHALQTRQPRLNVATRQKAYVPCNQHHYEGKPNGGK